MRHKMRRFFMALPVALMALLLAVQPALALAPAQTVDVGCEEGVCRFELDLGAALPAGAGFWLQVLAGSLNRLPGDAKIQVQDDIVLTLPVGTLVLPDADLTVEFGPDRRIVAMQGTAQMPVPTLGLFSGLQWVAPARVDIGYGLGAELAGLDAPLDPERRYLYVTMEAGLSAIQRGDKPALALEAPSGQHVALVMDLTQPLIFVDGNVQLRYLGDLAFVRELVDPTGGLAWWPTGLVLPQTVEIDVTGVMGQGVAPNLALTAGYRVDSGLIGQWFHLDGALVEAEGSLVLGPGGLLMAGKANSALVPEAMTESALATQLYIPFGDLQNAYAALQDSLQAPVVAILSEVPESAVAAAAAPIAATAEPEEAGRLATLAEASRTGVVASAEVVAQTAQAGYGAVVEGATAGIDWIAGTVTAGARYSQDQWCAVTGRCVGVVSEFDTAARVASANHN